MMKSRGKSQNRWVQIIVCVGAMVLRECVYELARHILETHNPTLVIGRVGQWSVTVSADLC